jgi:hypothetical protein
LAGTEAERQAAPSPPAPGAEPLTADLGTRTPRVPTRVLVVAIGVLVVLLLVSVVVGFVVLHQPRLTPVPVPSVSSIS